MHSITLEVVKIGPGADVELVDEGLELEVAGAGEDSDSDTQALSIAELEELFRELS